MRSILSEKNIAVFLFVMVLITFSLAQEDSKKMEKIYFGTSNGVVEKTQIKKEGIAKLPVADTTFSLQK